MIRARFKANADDFRPVKFPPPYPYWCTGYGMDSEMEIDHSIVVAYADDTKQLKKFWPEADDITVEQVKEIKFSERFPKPDWYVEEKKDE